MSGLTLEELRTLSKQRSDMENSGFIQDPEWNSYINESCSELHDLILQSDPKSIVTKYTLSTVGGQDFYPLPEDFYKLQAVYRIVGNTTRYSVDRVDFHGIGLGSSVLSSVISGGAPYQYALVGSEIYFLPIPNGINNVELWYYPSFTRLVADGDTLNYPVINGWEQFVIVATVIKAKNKERADASAENMQKSELKQRIVEMANKRDEWEPPKAYDAYGATSRNRRYNNYNPYGNLPYRFYK